MSFKHYIKKTYENKDYGGFHIFEVKLSRVWNHSNRGFIMASAFLDKYTLDENMKRHSELKSFIRQNDLGFFEIDGVYTYDDGHKESELSVFIPYRETMSMDEFKTFGKMLRKKFDQESILFGIEGKTVLLFKNKEMKIGNKMSVDKISNAYSKLKRGKNKDRTFVFEGVRKPNNFIQALSFNSQGIIY